MTLFNKKPLPNLFYLLTEQFDLAKDKNRNYFYYLLRDEEVELAEKWCNKNKARFAVDHKRDNNLIYKFVW